MFLLYIHANAVNNNKGNTSSGEQTSGLSMEFSIKVHVLCGSQRTFSAASYPDVSLLMKMCAQRKAGRRRLHPSHGSLRLITSHSPLPLTASKNEAREEEAAYSASFRSYIWELLNNPRLLEVDVLCYLTVVFP